MDISDVPGPLQDRLGHEATAGLIELLAAAREEWTAEMLERIGDRFERRLTDETTKVRVEMVQGFAALRQEMAVGVSQLRQEMAAGVSQLRQEMAVGLSQLRQEMAVELSRLRQEMTEGFAALRQELAETRVELLKWTFVFWVGQLFALAGFLAVLLRFLRPGG
jgi:dsDNA-specific endonuclease/ATPase MutS2